ncbi:DUF6262 family protein [Pseudogulbenkiania ferrooxidans]|uniref:Uncharacterized protein n=1 Tax=Pseudogulbenkiania ferrooxidans 2002 TaxID=279714 RepID=B9Z716_9NEIS|nr:DUF6262 family protein [Pseudogulbenkiania ferrooxidans]EEG07331.1 hypothetical protein FuraDRAFT_3152 [Pseudogulbenkiania ferrooxidans 2002]
MGISGKALGKQYLDSLRDYLSHTTELPTSDDGTLNITDIANKTGVPRQSFYKNARIKQTLEEARQSRNIPNRPVRILEEAAAISASNCTLGSGASEKKAKTLERRVNQLEQQNAALVAENGELRLQLKTLRLQQGREDMAIETGRRIPNPPDGHV